jgi:hypothetical protein
LVFSFDLRLAAWLTAAALVMRENPFMLGAPPQRRVTFLENHKHETGFTTKQSQTNSL